MAHSAEEMEIISGEIAKLLRKGVTKDCDREKADFIFAVFTRRRKDGDMNTILKLRQLNKHVTYQHFKIEPLSDAFKIIQPNCWMKDASTPCLSIMNTKNILNLRGIKSSTISRHAKSIF